MQFDLTITAALLLNLLTLAFVWYRTRRQVVDERFHDGRKRMDSFDLDIAALKQSVAAMPGRDDIHELQMTMSEMGGDMKAMRANMKAVADSLARQESVSARHEDYLRDK
ncbi:MAG: hypothetical protein COC12_08435 [Rhodobacteraceae bacterium]|nr:MAG: hypothetical protein COC12_08435 [Paracoccaceae bacterium]